MKILPWILIASRFLMGIVVILIPCSCPDKMLFVNSLLIGAAIITDIFDGIIARRMGISSDKLRIADSEVDLFFWLCVLVASFISFKTVMLHYLPFIICIITFEVAGYLTSFLRFRKGPSVHAWLSKLWNILLPVAFILLFTTGDNLVLKTALMLGIAARFEVFLVMLITRKWDRDIPTFVHAIMLRKGKEIRRRGLLNG